MKIHKILSLAAAMLTFLTACGADETAGTVGDGDPNKPNVSVGKLDFYANFESPSGLVTPRNVYVLPIFSPSSNASNALSSLFSANPTP